MSGYPPSSQGYGYGGNPPPQQPYGSSGNPPPPQPYGSSGANPPPYGSSAASPYAVPYGSQPPPSSAPYGAPPSAPYASPPGDHKPHKEKPQAAYGSPGGYGSSGGYGGYGAPPSGHGGGYGAPPPPQQAGYGSPFASLVPSAFPPGTDPNIVTCFQAADRDQSGFIDDKELQGALSSYNQSFSMRTVHLLMYLFTNSNVRKIGQFLDLGQSLDLWYLTVIIIQVEVIIFLILSIIMMFNNGDVAGPKEFTSLFYSLQSWRVSYKKTMVLLNLLWS